MILVLAGVGNIWVRYVCSKVTLALDSVEFYCVNLTYNYWCVTLR